ncbi:MAG: hypothetical protein ACREEM_47020 [Blastocatellia bacterium]
MADQTTLTASDEAAIQLIWWIGIALALIVTWIDVALLVRVIRAARKIDGLAARTLTAAGGIANHTAAIKNLAATNQVAGALLNNAMPIVKAAEAIEGKLAAVSAFLGRR